MQDPSELKTLIEAYKSLDLQAEPQRAMDLLQRAAALVDRTAAPQKWAALRSLYGDLAEHVDPAGATVAYRDALPVWQATAQHDAGLHCHLQLGCLLANAPPGSADGEAAITHLEAAVAEYPYLARLLATLYGFRPQGDPADNWKRRVQHLQTALANTDPAEDVSTWADVNNELAVAGTEEPAGDYAAALEDRLARHHAVLARLQACAGPVAKTCLHLATAYLDRVQGDAWENGQAAHRYAQQALDSLPAQGDASALEIEAWLLQARAMVFKAAPAHQLQALDNARQLLDKASTATAQRPEPELRASVDKLSAINRLALLRLGQTQHRDPFVQDCKRAIARFDKPSSANERRKVLQIQADGHLALGEYNAAAECCAQALDLAETRLAMAQSLAARLERIWELRDSATLLAFGQARAGQLVEAVDSLDRGKARLWRPQVSAPTMSRIASALPASGALVLPVFTAQGGLVILVTRGDSGPLLRCIELKDFGSQQVLELQRGADPAALGGWLLAYSFRRSEPALFQDRILAMGEALQRQFWTPVLSALDGMGVGPGSELVLLPPGASSGFPWQAAWAWHDGQRSWLGENYALRCMPALDLQGQGHAQARDHTASMAIVCANPAGDLPYSAIESAWIHAVHPGAEVLNDKDATRDKTLAALHNCSEVHIASHADFNLDDPFDSRLHLSDGDLTLAQWLQHMTAQQPDFVALSACETGVTRVTSLADEFLGFPAALLQAGVNTVLATQWSVDDAASALLMGQFYRERAQRAQSGAAAGAAECLRLAQRWLRSLTVAQLQEILRALRDHGGPAGERAGALRARLRGQDKALCPYAHPYFWAGFVVTGRS